MKNVFGEKQGAVQCFPKEKYVNYPIRKTQI
jgi:hypothetical protein